MPDLPPSQYLIVLRAEKDAIDPILRLRALLKRASRDYAFRCIRIEQVMKTDDIKSGGRF